MEPRRAMMPLVLVAAALLGAASGEGSEKEEIKVPGWPDLSGKVPLSSGIISHGMVFASGMAGFDTHTMKLVPGGVANETKQALTLVREIVEAGGSDMAHVVGCAVYLRDMGDFAAMNAVYATFFPKPRPVRVAVQIASLAGNSSVEIQCTASLPGVTRKEVVVPTWPDMTTKFPFSTAITSDEFVFASGFPGFDMRAGKLVPGGVFAETEQALSNIRETVEYAGSSMSNVVGCAVYLTNLKDFALMNKAYATFFPHPPPSRVAFEVAALAGGASVEIQCTAALPSAGRKQVVVPGWPDLSQKVPLSSGISAGGFLFASGLTGMDMKTLKPVTGGVQAETKKALENLKEVVNAGGSSMADVTACAVYLADIKDFAAMNEVYAGFFPKPPPARVATQIAALVGGAAVEIQCTAALPSAAAEASARTSGAIVVV